MKVRTLLLAFLAVMAVLALSACGLAGGVPSIGGSSSGSSGGAVTVNDIQVFPGATELKAGDSKLADTLSKNSQQITAMTQSLGAGGKTEQKGFALPATATWDSVKKYFDDNLKGSGWGDAPGPTASILAQMNSQNSAFQMAIYQKGNQNLSVIRVVTDPTTNEVTLILSLTTH